MSKINSSLKTYVDVSRDKKMGRGVFAKDKISKGELIERCPIIVLPDYETSVIEQSQLVGYTYFFGKHKNKPCLALGYGSLYNHSRKPNATYKPSLRKQIVEFIAIEKIEKGKEILVNYSKGSELDLWFKEYNDIF